MVQEMNLPDARWVGWFLKNIKLQLVNEKIYNMMEYVTLGNDMWNN